MTVFKCDRCGSRRKDALPNRFYSVANLYEISLNEFYICDGRYQPYGATYSSINLCQACFDELKEFLNAYGKEVLHDDHCRDERPTKNDAK